MHKKFDHKALEQKWQNDWSESKVYRTDSASKKPKVFVLDMFPYPSGEGLHVGHPKGFIATDIYSRMKRMNGFEVLHPMGWDAFGLPAENYALKNKVHPRVAVDKNIANFKSQLSKLGLDYDWSREINTTDPHFYKWTQWIFIQLFKKGLAYESHEPINWCPGCQTGLANEDLESDGTCERCGSVVEKRPMRQWVLKIREYADRMLEDLDTLEWPEHIKEAQRNWIGRSEGAEIDFALSSGDTVTVFTTRPDTLFGATYMVLAPEHELVQKNKDTVSNWEEVSAYITKAANKKEMDRLDDTKEKTGVKLEGITATNPANGETIPVYIADYVLASYGTGAIMAVPAHDERDGHFARKYNLPVRVVVAHTYENAKSGVETLERGDVVDLIIEHPTDGTFLLQREKDETGPDHVHFVGGGTEGKSHILAIAKELVEETGFQDFEIVGHPINVTRAFAYRHTKNKNQKTTSHFYHIKLKNLDKVASEIDEGKHSIEWVKKEMIEGKITWSAHRTAWRNFLGLEYFTSAGKLVFSGEFDGMDSEQAKQAIVEKVGGRMTKTYKIKDWVFSRQRYWGEPFPIVHAEDGKAYPVAFEQLPVELPEVEHYEPAGDGQSPLATIPDWVNVTGYLNEAGDFVVANEAPAGKTLMKGKRETNTMPQWAGSSWYYLRYIDPQNEDVLVDSVKEKDWQPVDMYVGGAEHATRHLIYARFWHKFLYDIGAISTTEPFKQLHSVGLLLAEDGRKMSKRWGNVINPDDIVALVGADTLRIYEMFMGPFENTIAWSQNGVVGARRFLERVNGLSEHIKDEETKSITALLHKTIKKIRDDIEGFKFNTAVSAMMVYLNEAEKAGITKENYLSFLKLLAPFAPHLTEELWRQAGEKNSIHTASFPVYEETLAKDETVTIGVQVNGKVRGDIVIAPDATEEEALKAARAHENVEKWLKGAALKKVIYRPGKILNVIV